MSQEWNWIERQVANALSRKHADRGHFARDTKEQLWVWQGRRRVDIKEALALALPAVYGPPRARLLEGSPDRPTDGQRWHVVTDSDAAVEVHLISGAAGKPAAFVVQLSETTDPAAQKAFCQAVSRMGLTGVSAALRGTDQPGGAARLAEIYLGLGRCYAGAVATDLLRVIDHLEQQFSLDAEAVILVLSGASIPAGLATAAIDQRISGLLIDFSDAPKSMLAPVGAVPLFRDAYLHLGANPLLVLAQCCSPRPMTVTGRPDESPSAWPANPQAGILPFMDQLAQLQAAYEAANHPGRLTIVSPDRPRPALADQINHTLEYYQTPAG